MLEKLVEITCAIDSSTAVNPIFWFKFYFTICLFAKIKYQEIVKNQDNAGSHCKKFLVSLNILNAIALKQ